MFRIGLLNILVLSWLLSITIVSLPVYASEFEEAVSQTYSVNSYELFHPMVAGVLPGQPAYFLKTLRDKKDEFFAFDRFEKSKVNLHLSNKRLLEGEQLLLLGKDELAIKTLKSSQKHLLKAINLTQKIKKEEEVLSISLQILETSGKQQKLLAFLAKNQGEEIRDVLENNYNFTQEAGKFSDELIFKFLHGERNE